MKLILKRVMKRLGTALGVSAGAWLSLSQAESAVVSSALVIIGGVAVDLIFEAMDGGA